MFANTPWVEVAVRLDFSPETTVLVVSHGGTVTVAASQLARTGGGFGLQGIRERVELVGGRVRAEPTTSGWTVEVAVPA
jgi:signal transduction histidine kinase